MTRVDGAIIEVIVAALVLLLALLSVTHAVQHLDVNQIVLHTSQIVVHSHVHLVANLVAHNHVRLVANLFAHSHVLLSANHAAHNHVLQSVRLSALHVAVKQGDLSQVEMYSGSKRRLRT